MLKCVGFIFVMTCSPVDGAPQGHARFCQTYTPIPWSMQDTRATRVRIKQENAKWSRLCKVVKP